MELLAALGARAAAPHSTRDAGNPSALFGIVQGGMYCRPARRVARRRSSEIGFDGYAIGGLRSASPRRNASACSKRIAPRMPADRPRYLMGVGTPAGHRRRRWRAASTCSIA